MFVLLCMLLLGSSCSFQRVLVVGVQQQQRRLNASRRSRRSCPNGTGAATSWLGGRRTSSNHQFPWTTRNSKPSVGLLFSTLRDSDLATYNMNDNTDIQTVVENDQIGYVDDDDKNNNDDDNNIKQEGKIPTNQELAMQRMQVSRAKRNARYQSQQRKVHRNYRLKQIIDKEQRQEQQQKHDNVGVGNTTMNKNLESLINATSLSETENANGSTSSGTTSSPAALLTSSFLYAVKVSVGNVLRQEMKLSGREKRGRVFIENTSPAVHSIKGLQQELFAFFRSLRKNSFVLSAGYPLLSDDGSVLRPVDESKRGKDDEEDEAQVSANKNSTLPPPQLWNIESDDDVQKTFAAAKEFFTNNSNVLKRPSIVIYIQRNPKAPPPPPPPSFLLNLPDPTQSPSMTMLSFYAFPPGEGIANPDQFAMQLQKQWKPFHALGRVYVAKEGVNAQMSVPTNVLSNFVQCCESIPEFAYMENGINIDPVPLSMQDFATAGTPADGGGSSDTKEGGASSAPPFRGLHIRVRSQVVADGLDKALDWQSAGYDMPPLEWHATLQNVQEQREKMAVSEEQEEKQTCENENDDTNRLPVILDCRNTYETDVGIFEGAEPLGTQNFRDTWDTLRKRLADTPKDAPIMTYCTGGIRCVKVGAYLTQEMGFTNVSRLAGGIIAYDRALQQQDATDSVEASKESSLFKGTNFVFDGRLGRPITEDSMGACITCGAKTSLVSNCRNSNCHKRMIQCEKCRTKYHGTCSTACKNRLLHGTASLGDPDTREKDENTEETTQEVRVFDSLDDYSAGQSTPPPSLYREMEFNTKVLIPTGSHMVSGETQGRLLKQLAAMSRHGRILELGTFTAYATSCLLEGACQAAESMENESKQPQSGTGSRQQGPYIMTMERDGQAFDVAVAQMQLVTRHGFGEEAAEALCGLRSNSNAVNEPPSVPHIEDDLVSLECSGHNKVGCDLVHVSDALATLEEMAAGRGTFVPGAPFDLVFVDADKTRLFEYADACLSSDRLLHKGGLIVVDNVLWKGLVLEAAAGNAMNKKMDDLSASSTSSDGSHDGDNNDHHNKNNGIDPGEAEMKRNRRARKLANKMHQFNSAIARDHRAEVLVLPLRDGLSIIRKK